MNQYHEQGEPVYGSYTSYDQSAQQSSQTYELLRPQFQEEQDTHQYEEIQNVVDSKLHVKYSEESDIIPEGGFAQAQSEINPSDFKTDNEQEKKIKKQGNVLSRAIRRASQFLGKSGTKESKHYKSEEDTSDAEDDQEPTFLDVSFFDHLKQQEKKEKKKEKKQKHPMDTHVLKEHILKAQKMVKVQPKEVEEIQDKIKKKYNYDKQGEIAVTNEMLENGIGVNQKDKLSFTEVLETTIELDNNDINNMVLASKKGQWNLVWQTLDKKPYLVNCIPEERAWSVLHQAIYHGRLETVRKLVEDYEADINICTKPDKDKIATIGTNSLALAYILERKDIFDYLLKYEITVKSAVKGEDISYFRLHTVGTVDPFRNYPLLHLTLTSYKSFISPGLSLQPNQTKHLVHLLPSVNAFTKWEDAKHKMCNTLYGIDRQQSESLRRAKSRSEFYREVIRVYTTESDVYKLLTPALIKQPRTPYKPLANDLALGPFAVMLTAILFKWDQLKPFQGITYRGVHADVTNKYEVGQTFIFLHFISTSKRKATAEDFRKSSGTLFIFDNGNNAWGPREIKKMSDHPGEDECLFPLGAEFKVVSVNKTEREIQLQLLDPSV